ncbi:hypothetical protein CYLTODRAFT_491511 [Cylindrobasidium torrendii FP15055 ss-10]|uniref:F-box domain-containing protein n=1 Tax=Cylindrobasidium torrendii FP15055 ss-10 TaxID=1314674 RepID=A0A0D7B7C9_9AGAR|nr:hypothetical protein CYLTODRAFT_491511 [Cylindrobasidium torrendii FP15055 ss-10]
MDLPAEVYARVFEIGVWKWGIGFLAPLRLTCRQWNDIVLSTPRLYGIINVGRGYIRKQLDLAKSAPISLTVPSSSSIAESTENILLSTARNWIYADIPVRFLITIGSGNALGGLQSLHLHSWFLDSKGKEIPSDVFDNFWETAPKNLQYFSAMNAQCRSLRPLLTSSIIDLELHRPTGRDSDSLAQYHHYNYWGRALRPRLPLDLMCDVVRRLPRLQRLVLAHAELTRVLESSAPARILLERLEELDLTDIGGIAHLLSRLQVPALRTLNANQTSSDSSNVTWKVVFMQWSQEGWIPLELHTLEMAACLEAADMPYFEAWIERLPELLRLYWDAEDIDIIPMLKDGKLASSLRELNTVGYEDFDDVLEMARNRKGTLRVLSIPYCGECNEAGKAEMLSLVDEVKCACLTCQMTGMSTV